MAAGAETGAAAAVEAATTPDAQATAAQAARFVLAAGTPARAGELRAGLAMPGATVATFASATLDELVLALPGRRFVSDAAAFEAGHALAAALSLPSAEPDIVAGVMPDERASGGGDLPADGGAFALGCWAAPDARVESRRGWAVEAIRAREAWAYADAHARPAQGAGIFVALPGAGGGVTGMLADAAPHARGLPAGVASDATALSQVAMAAAIHDAVDAGAAVIAVAFGGVYAPALARAVARAVAADAIVIAAAGDCVRTVAWPARLDEVVAVGGSNLDDAVWRGSCRGAAVDVCAPAENVWRAGAGSDAGGAGQGQGTGYAAALAAGAAACWLAYHGRARAVAEARVRGETVQALFRRMLKATARRPAAWDASLYGTGIVDAAALLAASFEAGRELETPVAPVSRPRGTSVRDLALERIGDAALAPGIDWPRHGGEISLRLLRRDDASVPASPTLARDLPAALRGALGIPALVAPATPAIAAPPAESGRRADPEAVAQNRRILAAREAAQSGGAGALAFEVEGTIAHDAPLPAPDAVLARVDAVMAAMPAGEMSDPAAFRQALDTMYRYAEPALQKLAPGASAALTHNEGAALEAIIIADGSRPSFLLKDGKPPLVHPFLGTWANQIAAFAPAIQKIARGVGRIQPTGGHASRYIGTGTLIDLDKLLVLTNYHVVDDARTRHGVPMTQNGRTLTVHGGLEIDFVGEAASLESVRFRVVEIALPEGFGRGIGVIDAAVLKIEPIASAKVPIAAVPRFSADAVLANGGMTSLATIGFPGPPVPSAANPEVDWAFVTKVLFDNKFGFKRLAPGTFWRARGFDPTDTARTAFGHDASTFGGASGSLVVAWGEEGEPAFGLHFAGFTSKSNYALSFAAAANALAAVGVPLAG